MGLLIEQVKKLRESALYKKIRTGSVGQKIGPVFHVINMFTSKIICLIYSKHGYRINVAGVDILVDPGFLIAGNLPANDLMLERLLLIIKPGQNFMDIGAYVGTYSIAIGKLHNGKVNVIGFEPSPDSAALFRKHLKYNLVQDNVRLEEKACSDTVGHARFVLRKKASCDIISSENRLELKRQGLEDAEDMIIDVNTITVDDYIEKEGFIPDYVKIDVEGAELQVLRGAKNLLKNNKPVIFCELHRCNWDKFGSIEPDLFELLKEVKYTVRDIVTGEVLNEIPPYCFTIMSPLE